MMFKKYKFNHVMVQIQIYFFYIIIEVVGERSNLMNLYTFAKKNNLENR